jgi:methylmalonyl-CoA mutase
MPSRDAEFSLNDFAPRGRADWRELVERALKGASFDHKLVSRTYDGLRIEPLSERAQNAAPLAGRAPGQRWQIMQRIDHPDPAMANAQILQDLENGASGLMIVSAGSVAAHGYGSAPSQDVLERVLEGVALDAGIAVELDLGPQAKDLPLALAALVRTRGNPPERLQIRFGFDPLGAAALSGGFPAPWAEIARSAAALASDLSTQGFRRGIMVADGRLVHAAGGSEAQELAYVLAVALAYLRALEAGGVAVDDGRRMLFFRLAADADQFLTVAKFRSLRKLWARIEQACGLRPEPAFVSAETAWRMMTRRDPWVNMLRTTMATFAAGIGGADAVSVLPFTAALGLPDAFARRMARNTQLILLEESSAAKVLDPAAGSGGIEALTESLCQAAWTLLQETEAAGGAAAALERGLIQSRVAETRSQRETAAARRKDALVGTSEFPHLQELAVAVIDAEPSAELPALPVLLRTAPLRPMRLAEPFERLRDASDRLLAVTGSRPKVFVAALGAPADYTARAGFAQNLFGAGGIETVTWTDLLPEGNAADMAALTAAFKVSGAPLGCLCSSDEVYAREAATVMEALRAAGARHLYVAGRPGDYPQSLAAAGGQTFIYVGCDVLATLEAAHDILGATA